MAKGFAPNKRDRGPQMDPIELAPAPPPAAMRRRGVPDFGPPVPPTNAGERFKVIVPNQAFGGTRNGLSFSAGVAYTDDEALVQWFMNSAGYAVIDLTTGERAAPFVLKHFRIDAPTPATFTRNGIQFEAGVGITDDPASAALFREMAGYNVHEVVAAPPRGKRPIGDDPPPKRAAKRYRILTGSGGSFIHGGLEFKDGVAETDSEELAANFRHFCKVEEAPV